MSEPLSVDVSGLPDYGFGDRSPLWWGMAGMIAIEGSAFALLLATYLYLRGRVPEWPPAVAPPALIWGTLNAALTMASMIPNEITKRAARREDAGAAARWLAVCVIWGLGLCAVRALEFAALNCRWDTNAYGSIVWTLLGFHTAHLVTDVADSIVLLWFLRRGPVDGPRFVDVSENAIYWYFVVLAWVPIYTMIYIAPRVL